MKLPPHHTWVETEDGSRTLFSERFGEACHSTSGAKAETILHYLKGCAVVEKSRNLSQLSILEVGFGLGIGLLTTWEEIKDSPAETNFLSLEIDRDLVLWFLEEHKAHPLFQNVNSGEKIVEGNFGNFSFTILIGDARAELPLYVRDRKISWNAIYQDAFSPKRNPALWTREWFEFLKAHSSQDVILSTYSASSSIRKSLHDAGWKLYPGEKFGPKRTSTRARLTGETDKEILEALARSPVKAITDEDLKP